MKKGIVNNLIKKVFIIIISLVIVLSGSLWVAANESSNTADLVQKETPEIEEEEAILEDDSEEKEPDKQKIEEEKVNPEEKNEKNGWNTRKSGGKIFYRYKAPGKKVFSKGRSKIGKNYYYFDKNGDLLVNQWIRINKVKTYYSDKNGVLAKGWKKISNFHYYFNESNVLSQDLIKEFGEEWYKKCNIHIKVNKYHNCVTIYAQSKEKKYNIPIKSFPCTSGYATPVLNTTLKKGNTYRWHTLMGPSYGQFCTRIHKGVLFHSVIYSRPNKYALIARQYNKLGITASHGCVRLAVIDAKRIYDDVNRLGKVGVSIYNDMKSVGPFDKPNYPKVKLNDTYDPTDPTIK